MEIQELIVRMATANRGRARKIEAELMELGIRVSLATVSRYVPKPKPDFISTSPRIRLHAG